MNKTPTRASPLRKFHQADAVLQMAHLHTDIERSDVHVALEVCERFAADTAASTVCEIVIETATIVAILESGSKTRRRLSSSQWLDSLQRSTDRILADD